MTIIDIMLSHEIVTRKVSISAGLLGWLTSKNKWLGCVGGSFKLGYEVYGWPEHLWLKIVGLFRKVFLMIKSINIEDFQFQVSYRGKFRQFYMPGESEKKSVTFPNSWKTS